jgi:alkylresorcinol/alkylpyrone synthase
MPRIENVATALPSNVFLQSEAKQFVRSLFSGYPDVDRLMPVFDNALIDQRHFVGDYDWYEQDHSFTELNDKYLTEALDLSCNVITGLLTKADRTIGEIDAIIFVSTTGISTPSIDARLYNILGFNRHIVRIPIWGLGCAGGASAFSRAAEYVTAHPDQIVLIVAVEICSLAFQKTLSKENLIAAALFADGAGAALVIGDKVESRSKLPTLPHILNSLSTIYPDTLDVMGWQITPDGFQVVLSKDIPSIVTNLVRENICELIEMNRLELSDISHYVTHPGGTKVLDAYQIALGLPPNTMNHSIDVLRENGNMSSCTVFFILERFMHDEIASGDYGILSALGPGFSSELVLLQWS